MTPEGRRRKARSALHHLTSAHAEAKSAGENMRMLCNEIGIVPPVCDQISTAIANLEIARAQLDKLITTAFTPAIEASKP
jgi:hypothetical protein